jgi:lipopolysaccharide/colanic/teichoic acid biosynthesis glycosyltransferase
MSGKRDRPRLPISKRLTDIAISAVGLLVLSPLLLLIALLVKLYSPGPLFYFAHRAGYKGHPFDLFKFRTMHVGADRFGAITAKNDPRIYPLGKLLRLFKLDEVPQLFNVLRGEMSLVGPRPEDLTIVRDCYSEQQRRVLEVPPGLTGLPQVRFFPEIPHGEDADAQEHYRGQMLPIRLEMDLEYIRRRSFGLDLYLILYTAYLILFKGPCILVFGHKRPSSRAASNRVGVAE